MTPRERVEMVLRGERPDRVPFTVYENKLPQCEAERLLRNDGACIIQRNPSVYRTVRRNVAIERVTYEEDGATYTRTNVRTPKGYLYSVERHAPDEQTTWHLERLFKKPEDYDALEFLIRDQEFIPEYEAFARAQSLVGGDVFLRPGIGYSPFQEILYSLMGLEMFSIEWAERRDEVLRIYDALTASRSKLYPVVARSPALAVNYCGNVSSEVVGLDRFEKYYLPHYNEFAEVMHKHGKIMGVHFDANNWALAELIGMSDIDYIEAFTPQPDCDMTVAEAKTAWHDKILWINFPSSVHLQDVDVIEQTTRQILWEAAPGDRFLVGITENVPEDRWQESMAAILRMINQDGDVPITWKTRKAETKRDIP
ncbi:MAG: hypothetical protein O2954_07715 [bacterium]|nr:hypothetical protein [bacterium]